MGNIIHYYFDNIDEIKQQISEYSINFLSNPFAERNYFSPLSIATASHIENEYVFGNYMDNVCYCIHTPHDSNFYRETLMHKHNFFEFLYVKRGIAYVRIEDKDFSYSTGNLCLLNRNTKHIETDISNADLYYIGIEPRLIIDWPRSILLPFKRKGILGTFFNENLSDKAEYKKDYINFAILNENNLVEIFDEMITSFSEKRIGYYFDIYSSLSRFFATLENKDLYNAAYINLEYDKDSLIAEKVKTLIYESHGCIKRTELARKLNYSSDYLSEIIKKYTGCTLKNFCQRIQMQEAARLLQTSSLPILQIALTLGYENRTQFYKIFEREFKVTPSEYREAAATRKTTS